MPDGRHFIISHHGKKTCVIQTNEKRKNSSDANPIREGRMVNEDFWCFLHEKEKKRVKIQKESRDLAGECECQFKSSHPFPKI